MEMNKHATHGVPLPGTACFNYNRCIQGCSGLDPLFSRGPVLPFGTECMAMDRGSTMGKMSVGDARKKRE